jgi:hypothetical protein
MLFVATIADDMTLIPYLSASAKTLGQTGSGISLIYFVY